MKSKQSVSFSVATGITNAVIKVPGSAANAGFTDLGGFGGNNGVVTAINNRGQAVGWATGANGAAICFLKLPGKPMLRIVDLIPEQGWTVSSVNGINDEGWIVGTGNKSGSTYSVNSFVLKPQ